MPPKPFNPPRPTTSSKSTSTSTASKPRGRPKGSTSASSTKRKSTASDTTPRQPKSKTKATSSFSKPRVSNASTALSIASDDEDEDIEMGSGEDDIEEADDDSDPFSSQPLPTTSRRKSGTTSTKSAPAENVGAEADGRTAGIPLDLINVLLHSFFKQEGTRVSKDANAAVGRYIETFVREGLARAEWARGNGWEGELEGGGNTGDGGYLEVEDLERLAPQLVLDF